MVQEAMLHTKLLAVMDLHTMSIDILQACLQEMHAVHGKMRLGLSGDLLAADPRNASAERYAESTKFRSQKTFS